MVRLVRADEPPRLVEFGGREAVIRREAADAFERELGRPIKRNHVPRAALAIGFAVLRPVKPVVASLNGPVAGRRPARLTRH
jgi:uncharacterized protein YbjT (DUF2867 family)